MLACAWFCGEVVVYQQSDALQAVRRQTCARRSDVSITHQGGGFLPPYWQNVASKMKSSRIWKAKKMVIEPVQQPRAGWFDGYRAEDDVDVWQQLPPDADSEAWE